MRIPFSRSEQSRSDRGAPAAQPEALRRQTLALNAKIIAAASTLAAVPAYLLLLRVGAVLPAIIATLGVGVGLATLALSRSGHHERAAAGQVLGMLIAGLILTAADPALADFGLAVALLAPVHAALLARSAVAKRAWLFFIGVAACAGIGTAGVTLWPIPFAPIDNVAAACAFALVAGVVAFSANRLNSIFEVHERAQVAAYRHLVEEVQDAVMRFAADGTMLFASHSTETLLGCRRYELGGNGLLERIHVLDRPAWMTAFADANYGRRARTIEVRMRCDGDPTVTIPSFTWIEAALSPVADPAHPAERHEVVAFFRDITARKESETEMRQARQAAEEASSAKSRFLATIGHELRTPLNAIVGFSEMMTSGVVGELAPTHREYAELIHTSGVHLIEVVQMLLDMSRIEAGKLELQTERFEPEILLEPCLEMVGGLARDKGVRLVLDKPRPLPHLVADERCCRQILINLLSNAIKFSHRGGEVRVSMRRQGRFLNLSVTDSGIGMSAEAVKRIGEAFFQADDSLARGYEGTGFGLSIVKGLVDLHQGELHAASTPGAGTTITVLLPLNGPAIQSVETGAVRTLHPEPNGQTEEEALNDGHHSVASAAARR